MDKLTYYKLYIKSKKLTNGFKDINLDSIKKEQRSLLILRSILNMNQRNFSKYLGISKSYLWALENNLNKLNHSRINQIVGNINKNFIIKDIGKEKAYYKYKILMDSRTLTIKRARQIRSMRKIEDSNLLGVKTIAYKPPLNDFERKIYCNLKNNKLNFKTNFPIKGKTKLCVVDFCIFKNNKPVVILEVKQTITNNTRRRYDILR